MTVTPSVTQAMMMMMLMMTMMGIGIIGSGPRNILHATRVGEAGSIEGGVKPVVTCTGGRYSIGTVRFRCVTVCVL